MTAQTTERDAEEVRDGARLGRARLEDRRDADWVRHGLDPLLGSIAQRPLAVGRLGARRLSCQLPMPSFARRSSPRVSPRPRRSRTLRAMRIRVPSVALIAVALGCAAPGCAALTPPLTSPAHGRRLGPSSPPGTTSSAPISRLDEAREALAEFEGVYNLFVDVAFPTDESRAARIGIVLFGASSDYGVLGRARDPRRTSTPGCPMTPSPSRPRCCTVRLSNETRLTFQHELTHHFMRQSLSHLPVWLNEGMADFYSTLRADGGKVHVGAPLPTLRVHPAPRWIFLHERPVHAALRSRPCGPDRRSASST